MSLAIELNNISKSFPQRTWKSLLLGKQQHTKALKNVSLSVKKGEIMGLLGPNGAGKTTLIKILATLISSDTGQGRISGLSLNTQKSSIRNKIGLVNTNDRTFYWRLTGWDNLDFFATLYNLTGTLKQKRIQEVLALTEMEDKADYQFMAYSAGQKQRLSIARALLARPEILLLDEATTSLDPLSTRRLLDFTRQTLIKKEKTTIVWCTHDLHEAEDICDRLAILHRGQILKIIAAGNVRSLSGQKTFYSCTVDVISHLLAQQEAFRVIPAAAVEQHTCTFSITRKQIPDLIADLAAEGTKIYQIAPLEQELETQFSNLIAEQELKELQ